MLSCAMSLKTFQRRGKKGEIEDGKPIIALYQILTEINTATEVKNENNQPSKTFCMCAMYYLKCQKEEDAIKWHL